MLSVNVIKNIITFYVIKKFGWLLHACMIIWPGHASHIYNLWDKQVFTAITPNIRQNNLITNNDYEGREGERES